MRLARCLVSILLSLPVTLLCAGPRDPLGRTTAPAGGLLHVARATTVRTRGSGNLSVDLPVGRAVVLVELGADDATLEPSPSDADLLRQFGVRRVPRYRVSLRQLEEDFLDAAAWSSLHAEGMERLRGRWPDLSTSDLERILLGDPYAGMTREQAEEAVGAVIFFREPSTMGGDAVTGGGDERVERGGDQADEEIWIIGRRSRAAELRAFTEGRERGLKAATFEEWLRRRARAVLRIRSGRVTAVEAPPRRGE